MTAQVGSTADQESASLVEELTSVMTELSTRLQTVAMTGREHILFGLFLSVTRQEEGSAAVSQAQHNGAVVAVFVIP